MWRQELRYLKALRPNHWSIVVAVLLAVGHVAVAHAEKGSGDTGSPVEAQGSSENTWLNPFPPGNPSHEEMFPRRNLPHVDPLHAPAVIPVVSVWALRTLLGKWQGIDPYATAHRDLADFTYTGVLECVEGAGGLVVETRWTQSWTRESSVKISEVHSRLFATAHRFYVDHTDEERQYQLVGLRSDSTTVGVRHFRGWGGEREEWRFIAPDTLSINVFRSNGGGGHGDINLFTKVKN
jgi:hypothetical protein